MDSVAIENEKNNAEKAEEVRPLVSCLLQPPPLIVPSLRNDLNGSLKPDSELIRSRKSFCANLELTGSRRPSAVVSAIPQERSRTSSVGNIFYEYNFLTKVYCCDIDFHFVIFFLFLA